MIPVSLYLKNFLSYGDSVPPLDFTTFDVACLSGDNGHGKSAILDAMTWALWGEARKVVARGNTSPAEGLLRIGATDMQVELVFDLDSDRYRVIRKFSHRRTSRSSLLEFQIHDDTSNAYKSLTEKDIGATQKKIIKTLRMNYETFINSAFILQGRIDEFTRKTPHKRKEILTEILDLARYERLADLAKDHHRTMDNSCKRLEGQLAVIHAELQHKAEYAQQLAEADQKLGETNAHLKQQENQKYTLEKERAELREKQRQLTERQQQQQAINTELERLAGKISRQEQQLADVNATLSQETAILQQYATYLDLSARHADYEEKLKQKLTCEARQHQLEQAIQRARNQYEREFDKWQAERVQIQKTFTETEHRLKDAQKIEQGFSQLRAGREQDDALEIRRNQVIELEGSIQKLEQAIARQKNRLEADLHNIEQQLRERQTLADKEIENIQQFEQCQAAVTQFERLQQQLAEVTETGTACKTQLEHLEAQRVTHQKKRADFAKRFDLFTSNETPQCPLCKSELDAHKKADLEQHFDDEKQAMQQEEAQIAQKLREYTKRRDDFAAQYKHIQAQMKKLAKVHEQLAQAELALQESRNAKQQVQELTERAAAFRIQLDQHAYAPEEHRQLLDLQRQRDAIGYEASKHQAVKQQIKTLQQFEGEYSKLEDTRERQRNAAASLPKIEQEIARIQGILDRQEYAQTEQTQLQVITTQLAAIGYDDAVHHQITRDFKLVQNAPIRKEQLEQARTSAAHFQQALEESLTERRQKQLLVTELQGQIETIAHELESLPNVEKQVKEIETQLHALRQERDAMLQRCGTFQSTYDHCLQLEQESAEQQAKFTQADTDRTMYGQLTKIFGKDGIQAHLIENAIPEIEQEANLILSRLTENRMQITIESQRDLQSGGTRETLDIKISDELGTRNYEMYSGGEAFRVDFAIRIALSKLLARRAGTQLKTLVIDEGFGTQDVHGLEQLVEAIKAISGDFEKILVITHLEALKNAFPVRIEVVKLPDIGSQYQIVH